jgi:hypothetical protein
MIVFYIENIISAYDGTITVGVASSLEKAVEHLDKLYKSGDERFVEDSLNNAEGHLITEMRLDDFKGKHNRFYNGKGKEIFSKSSNR